MLCFLLLYISTIKAKIFCSINNSSCSICQLLMFSFFLHSRLDFIQFINSLLSCTSLPTLSPCLENLKPQLCTNFTFSSSSHQQLDVTGENHRSLLTGLHLNCTINLRWELSTAWQKVIISLRNSLFHFPRRQFHNFIPILLINVSSVFTFSF